MAASATPRSADAHQPCVAVACSGGRDSTALLHATLRAAAPLGVRVVALHVHHGLSTHADAWLAHVEAQCRRWRRRFPALGFEAARLRGRPSAGESVEAWARRERYSALRSMALAHGAALVLLAHHRRDQAETFMLQALRGAGVAGQSAMPRSAARDGLVWARPWLGMPADAIASYVRRHRIAHIEDDSNADPRYARNRLRAEVWPALLAAFPDAERTLANAAVRAQQARAALDEWTALDLARVGGPRGLALDAWRALSAARRVHVLRAWLAAELDAPVSAALVERLLDEADGAGAARWPLPGTGRELRRYRGLLSVVDAAPADGGSPLPSTLRIARAGTYRVAGWTGRLRVERVAEGGVALDRVAALEARARSGGERFQLGPRRPPRALKKQYQALGIGAAERGGPLLYVGDALVYAPGLGIDARERAAPGVAQVALRWMPGASRDGS